MIDLAWSIQFFIFTRYERGDCGGVTEVQVTKTEVYLRLFSTCFVSYLIVFILLVAHGVGGRQHNTILGELVCEIPSYKTKVIISRVSTLCND